MIVVDTSALMAIIRKEALGQACEQVLRIGGELLMSTGTLTECLIVARGKGALPGMQILLDDVGFVYVDVTPDFARRAAGAYTRYGKGVHNARLNYGDCFSYALAELYDCPLLYVGHDFSQTDIRSALD